jgi:hypothetical protein
VIFFDVDLDVISVGFFRIDPLSQMLLHQEYLDGGNPAADAGDNEHCRKEYREQLPQDIDKKSESDEQHSDDEKSGREVSGGLRNCVCVKAKTHFRISSVVCRISVIGERRYANKKENSGSRLEPAFHLIV